MLAFAAGRPQDFAPAPRISDAEFTQLARWLYQASGIRLGETKKPMVCARLDKRLAACGCVSYAQYLKRISGEADPAERQRALDLLTTNETYFFREPDHFHFLEREILPQAPAARPLRIWSAACSSGEEPYTLAMCAEAAGVRWEILGSDLSTRVLERARAGIYPMTRAHGIPPAYLKRFCLRGTGEHEGYLRVQRDLRQRLQWQQLNLSVELPQIGEFDMIFLRNVMIYFDMPTKRAVVERLLRRLRPGGHLFIGHSESLNGIVDGLRCVAPTVYRRP